MLLKPYIKETKCAVESYSCVITKLLPLETVKVLFEFLHTYVLNSYVLVQRKIF